MRQIILDALDSLAPDPDKWNFTASLLAVWSGIAALAVLLAVLA
jgi:hypothetical protein